MEISFCQETLLAIYHTTARSMWTVQTPTSEWSRISYIITNDVDKESCVNIRTTDSALDWEGIGGTRKRPSLSISALSLAIPLTWLPARSTGPRWWKHTGHLSSQSQKNKKYLIPSAVWKAETVERKLSGQTATLHLRSLPSHQLISLNKERNSAPSFQL